MDSYPELGDRVQSTFIDTLFILVMMFIAAAVLDRFEDVPDWVRILLFVALFLAYEPVFMSMGCTLGNYIKGIRVRRNGNTSKRIHIFQALVRYPVKVVLGWIS